ncbi:olfactory receptor 1E16-like [Ambystoma mexicanum]|uniref:olfactory receptor 1E16-like n=1 Tax=Ambystoma mexicanum TaxID=8296 RepID=UPI0037E983C4
MMEKGNHSRVSEFILLGFSEPPEHSIILFVCFLTIYLVTLVANGTIIFIIHVDARLHTPMYFLLRLLSFVDICLPTTTVPKLLDNVFSKRKTISFTGCFLQLHFYSCFGMMKDFLIGIMAIDRYIAISKPLHYTMLMSNRLCARLVIASWLIISLHSAVDMILTARLNYCGSNVIHHYFCEIVELWKLSCSDTSLYPLLSMSVSTLFLLCPICCIITSYTLIIVTIWRMHSSEGAAKAFSTCTSHLSVVAITYVPLLYVAFHPTSPNDRTKDIIISVLFTLGCSLLNPFVYSIRNNEFKKALTKVLSKRIFSWNT